MLHAAAIGLDFFNPPPFLCFPKAALKGMDTLLQMFFRRGGNPNILNMNNETCLHAVCREPGQDNRKRGLLLAVLQWEGHSIQGETEDEDGVVACSVSEEGERVSVNMV